jgi:tyrosinase
VSNGIVLRMNASNLVPGDLAAFRDAYAKMMAISDNRGWLFWSGIHGQPQEKCWHHYRIGSSNQTEPVNLFLPWHRAYLLLLENNFRDLNGAAALPWWDWTSDLAHQEGIPAAFTEPVDPDGNPNPLLQGPTIASPSGSPTTSRNPDDPGNLPAADQVASVEGLSSYTDFSDQLEDVHDAVHGWVGGDMGIIASAAYDPIFYTHHCMIDRLWYLWQLQNGVNNIPASYLDLPLAPFPLKVRDVLNIQSLGYEYASAAVAFDPNAAAAANVGVNT